MRKATLILGDQLFESNTQIETDVFVMIESVEEASRHRYHAYRLAYLFSCMREHRDYLVSQGKTVLYYPLEGKGAFGDVLSRLSGEYPVLQLLPVSNHWFRNYVTQEWTHSFAQVSFLKDESECFLTSPPIVDAYLKTVSSARYSMAHFYQFQRKRMNILIEEGGKPMGGKWSFDTENRKKLPKTQSVPDHRDGYISVHYTNISTILKNIFSDSPGVLQKESWLPMTYSSACLHFERFISERLTQFGDYEDAMSTRDWRLFHSTISPLLNNGLLTPSFVVEQVLKAFNSGSVPLASVEGFIRQVIGWREWVKMMYDRVYTKPLHEYNYFGFTTPLPEYFYDPDSVPKEIQDNIPLMDTLRTVREYGWCHHIPRLMILANWMVLNRYDPLSCYEWFLTQFVDASEWVMVANVFGMGLFADGGLYATKPYISGGNYLKKMSDYPDSEVWAPVWTRLYWEFLRDYGERFADNPRMAMILKRNPLV